MGDYEEVYANVSFGGFSAGVAFSDEYWFETGEIVYLKAGYDMTLPGDWGLSFLVGTGRLRRGRLRGDRQARALVGGFEQVLAGHRLEPDL